MKAKTEDFDVRHEDKAARDWLRSQCATINAKWKNINLQWFDQTHQQFKTKLGNRGNTFARLVIFLNTTVAVSGSSAVVNEP